MSKIYNNITETIGNTPLVRIPKIQKELKAEVLLKLEYFNPMSSVKDRVGFNMLKDAIDNGKINNNTTVIEATSGNTGIGIAFSCASFGIKLIIVMPDTMSIERRKTLKALGAELVLTDGTKGMKESIRKAKELLNEIPDSIMLSQFTNPANPMIHKKTTALEIWNDTDGKIDIFVAGVGTGGTITGCSEVLKEKNSKIITYAVEPSDSPIITQTMSNQELKPSPHKIQGIGAGFIPEILNLNVIDHVINVTTENAIKTSKRLCKEEGIMVGISSGAIAYAAFEIAKRNENKDKQIVAIMCDSGERYLSSVLYEDI